MEQELVAYFLEAVGVFLIAQAGMLYLLIHWFQLEQVPGRLKSIDESLKCLPAVRTARYQATQKRAA